MLKIPGYNVREQIYKGERSVVYRATQADKNLSVIIKKPQSGVPENHALKELRREFETGKNLRGDYFLEYYSLESVQNTLILTMEDWGGQALDSYMPVGGFSLKEFLKIAIQLSKALEDAHSQKLIHKDIHPGNILFHPGSAKIKLIDFSISTKLTRETRATEIPELLEGTLEYMSPEQTGRMNRPIDYRSDFYSLGVTLYKLLTGRLPYESIEALDIIHCHIARPPRPLTLIREDLPPIIWTIISRLLEKEAEERYQSSRGITADLQKCLDTYQENGSVPEFTIGTKDYSEQFQLTQKLYGRDQEMIEIWKLIEAANPGQLLLLTGEPGTGKTSLVTDLQQHMTQKQGYFIYGRFEPLRSNIAYSAIKQALSGLIKLILTENESSIQAWKEKIIDAVRPNGRLLFELAPDLKLIIGEQPALEELEPARNKYRFEITLQNFLNIFASSSKPLILFIDDIHSADTASLELIKLLSINLRNTHLYIIAASHPGPLREKSYLTQTIADIAGAGVEIHELSLTALSTNYINHWLSESFNLSMQECEELSKLVQEKTGGNPFFLKTFLQSLYEDGLIYYMSDSGWRWDLEIIKKTPATENVADFMVARIKNFSHETRNLLKTAACLGNSFTQARLALATGIEEETLKQTLAPALKTGFLIFSGERYTFPHDRIQEAAYSLLSEEEKVSSHYRLGQCLYEHMSTEEREDNIFLLTDQYNKALPKLKTEEEQALLVSLNILAGARARKSNSYKTALKYFITARRLLPEDGWRSNHERNFQVYMECAECLFLSGDFTEAENISDTLLSNAITVKETTRVYLLQLRQYTAMGRLNQALESGFNGLKILKIKIPRKPGFLRMASFFLRTKLKYSPGKIRKALQAENTSSTSQAEANLEFQFLRFFLVPLLLKGEPTLAALTILNMLGSPVQGSKNPQMAFTTVLYACLLHGTHKNHKNAREISKWGMELIYETEELEYKCRTIFIYATGIHGWHKHWKNLLPIYNEAIQYGRKSGDLYYMAYACAFSTFWEVDLDLENALKIAQAHKRLIDGVHFKGPDTLARLNIQWKKNQLGKTEHYLSLNDEGFEEERAIKQIKEEDNVLNLMIYNFMKMRLNFVYANFGEAWNYAERINQHESVLYGTLFLAEVCFYRFLTITGIHAGMTDKKGQNIQRLMKRDLDRMKSWAESCPDNFEHKYFLMQAEQARILGDTKQTISKYEEALASAKEYGWMENEALIYEIAARFYAEQVSPQIAGVYLQNAIYLHNSWGALGRSDFIRQKYSETLLSNIHIQNDLITSHRQEKAAYSESVSSIDLNTVARASQAISQEINQQKLLVKILQIVIENAGAEKGFLILPNTEQREVSLKIAAMYSPGSERKLLDEIPLPGNTLLSENIVNYVYRTGETLILHNAHGDPAYRKDEFIQSHASRSILCTPVRYKHKTSGVLYLQNDLTSGAFLKVQIELFQILLGQAAISLENARLYSNMLKLNKNLEKTIRERREMESKFFQSTARSHRIEKELNESEEKYRNIFNNAQIGLFRANSESNTLVECNDLFSQLTGYDSRQDCLNDFHVNEHFTEENGKESLFEGLLNLGEMHNYEMLLNRRGGSRIWVSISARLFKSSGIIEGAALDITERRRAEAEIHRLNQDLERKVKERTHQLEISNEELESFSYSVSHDLRAPLRIIDGYSMALEEDYANVLDEDGRQFTKRIRLACKRMGELIDDLLNLSHVTRGSLVKQDLNITNLATEIMEFIMRNEPDRKITVDIQNDITESGDKRLIQIVLENLLRNAWKYTSRKENALIEMGKNEKGVIYIRDNGAGFEMQYADKLFGVFQRLHKQEEFEGNGIGLATVKRIIMRHGGKIWAEAKLNQGATFFIDLSD